MSTRSVHVFEKSVSFIQYKCQTVDFCVNWSYALAPREMLRWYRIIDYTIFVLAAASPASKTMLAQRCSIGFQDRAVVEER